MGGVVLLVYLTLWGPLNLVVVAPVLAAVWIGVIATTICRRYLPTPRDDERAASERAKRLVSSIQSLHSAKRIVLFSSL